MAMIKQRKLHSWLTRMVNEQAKWMQSCGGTIQGYILHYTTYGRTIDEAKAIFHADYNALANLHHRLNTYESTNLT